MYHYNIIVGTKLINCQIIYAIIKKKTIFRIKMYLYYIMSTLGRKLPVRLMIKTYNK